MKDVDPAEVAADMLREALPGFASRINPATNQIVVDGALRISTSIDAHVVRFPVYVGVYRETPSARTYRDALVPDVMREAMERDERAKQTEALRRELAPLVAKIVEDAQRFGIKALGLEAVIAEREKRAAANGRLEGYADGKLVGAREARAELLEDAKRAARRELIAELEAEDFDDE